MWRRCAAKPGGSFILCCMTTKMPPHTPMALVLPLLLYLQTNEEATDEFQTKLDENQINSTDINKVVESILGRFFLLFFKTKWPCLGHYALDLVGQSLSLKSSMPINLFLTCTPFSDRWLRVCEKCCSEPRSCRGKWNLSRAQGACAYANVPLIWLVINEGAWVQMNCVLSCVDTSMTLWIASIVFIQKFELLSSIPFLTSYCAGCSCWRWRKCNTYNNGGLRVWRVRTKNL